MTVANKCCLCGQTKISGAIINGVHVTIARFGNKEWIIPACKSCNGSGSDITMYMLSLQFNVSLCHVLIFKETK